MSYRKISSLLHIDRRTVKEIYRHIADMGYAGKYGMVRQTVAQIRKTGQFQCKTVLSRKYIIRLLYKKMKANDRIDKEMLRKIYRLYPKVKILFELFYEFKSILLKMHSVRALEAWIKKARKAGFNSVNGFINGMTNDYEAVKNSIIHKESNGIVEASVNKLKLAKRIMYGRCSFELLRSKVLRTSIYT